MNNPQTQLGKQLAKIHTRQGDELELVERHNDDNLLMPHFKNLEES